jgi:predicted RNA-binding Zn ribbon-like protein
MADPATERYAAAPAPLSLRRVQSFMNTRAVGRLPEPDLLARPAAANEWLRSLDWHDAPRMRADDLFALRQIRGALQAHFEALQAGEQPMAQQALAVVLENLRWRMTLEEGQLALAAEGAGWQQVAGRLLSDILLAQQHDLWPRLKRCRNASCSVVFYDNSKNRSRVWHNTSVCGNLINLRAARARRHVAA